MTLSSQVGATKPAPAIFARALAWHGIDPSRALHVGDSPGEDGDGAVAAGLRAVLIDRAGRHADRPGLARIGSLSALPALIRNTG